MSNTPVYVKALEALRRREGLFRVLIFTLVTVLFWIGFSIFQAQSNTKVTVDIRKHTEPLNPNINRDILTELLTRKHFTPEELQSFPLYERIVDENGVSQLIVAGTQPIVVENEEEPEITPEPTEAPTATESAAPTEETETTTEAATPSATISSTPTP